MGMKQLWLLSAAAVLFAAVAQLFFRETPLTALGLGLLAIVFTVAAMRA